MTADNRGKLVGVGIVPEGSFNNPVIFELLSDIAVTGSVPENLEKWLEGYLSARYGKSGAKALVPAWKILAKTAYSYTAQEGPINSALPARPHFGKFIKARYWASNMAIPYDNAELLEALKIFDANKEKLQDRETFRYDYADLLRQVTDNLSHTIFAKLNAAMESKNKAAFADASKDFMRLFELLDTRFSQFPRYKNDARNFSQSFAKWCDDAQKSGREKEYALNCAKLLLTRWVERPGTDLDDYAFREWTGLTGSYYAPRWKMFFDEAKKALDAGTDFDQNAFNEKLNEFETSWKPDKNTLREPNPNIAAPVRELEKLQKKYAGTQLETERPQDGPLGVQAR